MCDADPNPNPSPNPNPNPSPSPSPSPSLNQVEDVARVHEWAKKDLLDYSENDVDVNFRSVMRPHSACAMAVHDALEP